MFKHLKIRIENPIKNILLLGFFYLIGHGGILLMPNALFWDDWIIYRSSPSDILELFRLVGSIFSSAGYLHIWLSQVGLWTYKLLTFILMFACGLLLNIILKRFSFIDDNFRFFIVLLFLILPFNIARVTIIVFPYTLCYFLFFLAWALFDRHRIISLMLFFISFSTNSLLVFYAMPFMEILYKQWDFSSWKKVFAFVKRNIDFILLPFIFFFIKTYFFKPSGVYENYNRNYNFKNIIDVPLLQYADLLNFHASFNLALIFTLISFCLFYFNIIIDKRKKFELSYIFLIGIIIFFLGSVPYWILGYVPTFFEWTSRHQLLLPLGTSIILVSAVFYLRALIGFPIIHLVTISIIIGTSLAYNITNYINLIIDSHKQQQLVLLFSEDTKIKNGSLIVFNDQTIDKNAFGRGYRFYEWNGLLELSFANQKRFGINQADFPMYIDGLFKPDLFTTRYKAGAYIGTPQINPVYVEINSLKPYNSTSIIDKIFPKFYLSTVEKGSIDIK